MPWEVTGPVKERTRFIETYLTGLYTISELPDRFSVSRQKLHKWLARHNAEGMKGLVDRARAPLHIPHRTSESVVGEIIAFRRRFPHMGPRKIIARLTELHPDIEWPAPSTTPPREPGPAARAPLAAGASAARTQRAGRAQ